MPVIANSIGGHKSVAVFPAARPIAVITAIIAVAAPRTFLPCLVFIIDEVAIAEVPLSSLRISQVPAGSIAGATLANIAETLRPSAVAFNARLVNASSEILPARVARWAASSKLAGFAIVAQSPLTLVYVTRSVRVTALEVPAAVAQIAVDAIPITIQVVSARYIGAIPVIAITAE
jgi:hypothetical protein